MKTDLEISVIVPTYNPNIVLLQRSIQSILQQTYNDFETIIIDDGSEQSLAQQIDELTELDDRIQVIHQQNQGVSVARNRGISESKGKYIAFVDDDDIVSPFFLEESREILWKYDCDMVVGGTIHQRNDIIPEEAIRRHEYKVDILEGNDCKQFAFHMLGRTRRIPDGGYIGRGPWARLIRRDISSLEFPPGYEYGEDRIWNILLSQRVKRIAIAERIWYLYIENQKSVTRRCTPNAIEETEKVINTINSIMNLEQRPKDYGDYVYHEFKMLCIKWFCHINCPLPVLKKISHIRKLVKRKPWNILTLREYQEVSDIKRRICCQLIKSGLIVLVWKYRLD